MTSSSGFYLYLSEIRSVGGLATTSCFLAISRCFRRNISALIWCLAAFAVATWSVDNSSEALANPQNPNGVAVIVGNMEYEHGDVPAVDFAHRDAEAFRRYVIDVLGFDEQNVIFLKDATRTQLFNAIGSPSGTMSDVQARVRTLDSGDGADVIFFYSGHGVPGEDYSSSLLPADVAPHDAQADSYPIVLLIKKLGELKRTKSVRIFLDACFSGTSEAGRLIDASPGMLVPSSPEEVAKNMSVFTAVEKSQIATWDPDAQHGLFTHHILDALYGKADKNGDGKVTVAETKKYLDQHMSSAAWLLNRREQTADLMSRELPATAMTVAVGGEFAPQPKLAKQAPIAQGMAKLVLHTDPANARVRVSGESYVEGMTLTPGTHRLVVEADGHESVQRALNLSKGTGSYLISLCRFETRNETVCVNETKTSYKKERRDETVTIDGSFRYKFRGQEREQIAAMFERRGSRAAKKRLNKGYCNRDYENSPVWELEEELQSKCRRRDGEFRPTSFEYDCSCTKRRCTARGSADCLIETSVKKPVQTVDRVCRDEPREKRVCPAEIVQKLQ